MCEDGFCKSFARILLVIINIIFLLGGLLMLAFGIAIVVAPEKVFSLFLNAGASATTSGGDSVETILKACGIFMIILGGITVLVAFFGFFGACCDNKCLLVTYAVILIVVVLAEVALIIFAAVYPGVFNSVGQQALNKTLAVDFKNDVNITNGQLSAGADGDSSWEALQLQFGCCGAFNYTDYAWFNWNKLSCSPTGSAQCPLPTTLLATNANYKFPISCCKLTNGPKVTNSYADFQNVDACLTMGGGNQYMNSQGCFTTVANSIDKYGNIAIGIAAGIVGLELILIVLAFVMCCIDGRDGKYV